MAHSEEERLSLYIDGSTDVCELDTGCENGRLPPDEHGGHERMVIVETGLGFAAPWRLPVCGSTAPETRGVVRVGGDRDGRPVSFRSALRLKRRILKKGGGSRRVSPGSFLTVLVTCVRSLLVSSRRRFLPSR